MGASSKYRWAYIELPDSSLVKYPREGALGAIYRALTETSVLNCT